MDIAQHASKLAFSPQVENRVRDEMKTILGLGPHAFDLLTAGFVARSLARSAAEKG